MYKTIFEKMIKISRDITAINKIRFSQELTYDQNHALNLKVASLKTQYELYKYILKNRTM